MNIEPIDTYHLRQGQHGLPEARTPQKSADPMLLDDTKHTVFIHDIDREILDDNTQRGVINFLPGVTETLMPIPKSFVVNAEPQSKELVLYREPKSLSIPVKEDFVRRAIIETWERVRTDSGFFSASSSERICGTIPSDNEKSEDRYCYGDSYRDEGDGDLMDID